MLVISPADGLVAPFENTMALGAQLVRFSTLKNSARNCRSPLSVIREAFEQRHVQIRQPRTGKHAAPQVSVGARRGHNECIGIEPLAGISKHHRSGERGIPRRPVGIACVAVA